MMPNKHPAETFSRNNSASMQDDDQPPRYDEVTQSSVVVACTNGKCLGINLHNGSTVWVSGSISLTILANVINTTAIRLSWWWR